MRLRSLWIDYNAAWPLLKRGGPVGTVNPERADLISQLERLSALRDQRHLSAVEFESAKRKLLDN